MTHFDAEPVSVSSVLVQATNIDLEIFLVSQPVQLGAYLSTYVVHPSFALLGQVPCPDRDDCVVVLEVVGKVTEKIDETTMKSSRSVSLMFR